MSSDVLYTTRWNTTTRGPVINHRSLTAPEARALFEEGSGGFQVVDASVRDEGGLPQARWVLEFGMSGRVRAEFLNAAGSIWRSTDYDVIDGRLWRWISCDYTYPDDVQEFRQNESTMLVRSQFRPDGSGFVDFIDPVRPEVDRACFQDAPVSGFWMDRPAFGHWDQLADPDYGSPPAVSANGAPVEGPLWEGPGWFEWHHPRSPGLAPDAHTGPPWASRPAARA